MSISLNNFTLPRTPETCNADKKRSKFLQEIIELAPVRMNEVLVLGEIGNKHEADKKLP